MLDDLAAGQILLADRAYDSDAARGKLAKRGAFANIKPMPNRRNVPAFNTYLYRFRNLVERFFNKLKHFRGVATRYDSAPTTSSQASNSLHSEFCADIMSR
jgi:transposase